MKRYCKNINLLDENFLFICVRDCLKKKWKRKDVRSFFVKYGNLTHGEVTYYIENDKSTLILIAVRYVKECLETRMLKFPPIWNKYVIDKSSGKERKIGIQNIRQQFFDYVAVYALKSMLKRIGEYQMASIKGRGPLKAMQKIQKWMNEPDVNYSAQLDIKKCFPSIPQDHLITFIEKYVYDDLLKWLVISLIKTFDEGLAIGSFLSQYLCNLYLSKLYHYIAECLYFERRGKRINLSKHRIFYMDDLIIFSSNSAKLHQCVSKVIAYAKNELGLDIKPNWIMKKIKPGVFIDAVGYRIYSDRVTIRKRVFLRIRRAYKKVMKSKIIDIRLAKRCQSYLGELKYSSSYNFNKKYKVYKSSRRCRKVISYESKIQQQAATG